MAGVTSLSIALSTTRTCRIGDAELTRVEKEGVGVGDVEVFFLFD